MAPAVVLVAALVMAQPHHQEPVPAPAAVPDTAPLHLLVQAQVATPVMAQQHHQEPIPAAVQAAAPDTVQPALTRDQEQVVVLEPLMVQVPPAELPDQEPAEEWEQTAAVEQIALAVEQVQVQDKYCGKNVLCIKPFNFFKGLDFFRHTESSSLCRTVLSAKAASAPSAAAMMAN